MKKNLRNLLLWVKGKSSTKEYHEIMQIRDKNDLLNFQTRALTELIMHAYHNVPYYRNVFDAIGLVDKDIVRLEKFTQIPILTKDYLKKHQNELTSKDYLKRKWYRNYSGGSTGEPTMFLQDGCYKKWYTASDTYYYNELLGIDESNVRKVFLWGSPRDLFKGSIGIKNKMINWLTNTLFLNSFKMDEQSMLRYIKAINTYKPDLVRGYAGSLYELAKCSRRNNATMHTPKRIVSSAENLTPEMRTEIESVFRTKVFDYYGSRETATVAGECRDGLMHIFTFNNLLEVVDKDGNPVAEGQKGRILVTNLHNYSMPFIRYEIGDMAVLGPTRCTCGSFLPCLRKISGRVEEHFIKKDGSIVIGYFFVHLLGVVLNKGYIKKFQVVQEDFDRIRIITVVDKGLPDSEKNEIEQKIRIEMGLDCTILWEFVDAIPCSASGKYFYTKSLVKTIQ